MIQFKSNLSKKDKLFIREIIDNVIDEYKDFYITRDNLRLFIKDNLDVFFSCLKQGDKIAFYENGIAFITGFSDKAKRKYIKVLAKDKDSASNLLKIVNWNIKIPLFVKIKKYNPIKKAFLDNNYVFKGGRGSEVLLQKR